MRAAEESVVESIQVRHVSTRSASSHYSAASNVATRVCLQKRRMLAALQAGTGRGTRVPAPGTASASTVFVSCSDDLVHPCSPDGRAVCRVLHWLLSANRAWLLCAH